MIFLEPPVINMGTTDMGEKAISQIVRWKRLILVDEDKPFQKGPWSLGAWGKDRAYSQTLTIIYFSVVLGCVPTQSRNSSLPRSIGTEHYHNKSK